SRALSVAIQPTNAARRRCNTPCAELERAELFVLTTRPAVADIYVLAFWEEVKESNPTALKRRPRSSRPSCTTTPGASRPVFTEHHGGERKPLSIRFV